MASEYRSRPASPPRSPSLLAHPIDDLVLRWARTHGPFVVSSIAERYGLGRAVVESSCDELAASGSLAAGSFLDMPGDAANERRQYCHSQVLALIKRRTLALLRKGVEPVEQVAFARFLAEWQGIGSDSRGVDAVLGSHRTALGLSDSRECRGVDDLAGEGRRLRAGDAG